MTSAPSTPAPLRVCTYNIGYASGAKNNRGRLLSRGEVTANLDAIAATLRAIDADVVGLQEVDFRAARTFDIDQLHYLRNRLDYPYCESAVTWDVRYLPWPCWPPWRQYGRIRSGQAILSRSPLRAHRVHRMPKPRRYPWWFNWFYLDRLVQSAEMDYAEQPIRLWHLHLEAFDPVARQEQIRTLAELMTVHAGDATLACGDINADLATPDDGVRLLVAHSGLDCGGLHTATAHSFRSWDPIMTPDAICHSPHWQCDRYATIPAPPASDHLPVVGEYRLMER